ncbi:MAG: hypothetical protein M1817_000107 [Caeruleum heppii]|nr:MAG: hypothetical protein M1817_000107 [Caeruleum heppii]
MGIIESANALPLARLRQLLLSHDPSSADFVHPNNENHYTLTLETSTTISPADFESCFNLIQSTSGTSYESSSIGWSPSKKRKEMKLPDLRYLLVKRGTDDHSHRSPRAVDQASVVDAFLSFMFTYEDGHDTVYCYELHLSPELRGAGLGRRLMSDMEHSGRRVGVEKAMLTVFLTNEPGLRFYEKLGYAEDDYSPGPRKLRGGKIKMPTYAILSKALKTPPSTEEG